MHIQILMLKIKLKVGVTPLLYQRFNRGWSCLWTPSISTNFYFISLPQTSTILSQKGVWEGPTIFRHGFRTVLGITIWFHLDLITRIKRWMHGINLTRPRIFESPRNWLPLAPWKINVFHTIENLLDSKP